MHRTVDAPRTEPQADASRTERQADVPLSSLAFPGCRSFRLSRDAVDDYDERYEFWDAATETAWAVAAGTWRAHEKPSRRLSALGEVIASIRGGPIEHFGSMDLIWNARQPERRRILRADDVVYLYPARARQRPSRRGSSSASTTCPTSSWRSTAPRTSAAASSASTPCGVSPRYGSTSPTSRLPPIRRAGRPD